MAEEGLPLCIVGGFLGATARGIGRRRGCFFVARDWRFFADLVGMLFVGHGGGAALPGARWWWSTVIRNGRGRSGGMDRLGVDVMVYYRLRIYMISKNKESDEGQRSMSNYSSCKSRRWCLKMAYQIRWVPARRQCPPSSPWLSAAPDILGRRRNTCTSS